MPPGIDLPANFIDPTTPSDLNPNGGGAPNANLIQASIFAWQEFIALNWPAVPQSGAPNTRDYPDTTKPFGDPSATGPLVWETFRSKSEIYPGVNYYNLNPPPPIIPMPTSPVFRRATTSRTPPPRTAMTPPEVPL